TSFSTAPYAILRTSVMMIGELDFNSVFHDDVVHYWITYVFFYIFLIVMTIVLMNLLIGLAIDDIKAIQDHATLERIHIQMKIVLDIEGHLSTFLEKPLCDSVYYKLFDSWEDMKNFISKEK
ncbi:TRPA1-like protein, partial [Mya arenaria]